MAAEATGIRKGRGMTDTKRVTRDLLLESMNCIGSLRDFVSEGGSIRMIGARDAVIEADHLLDELHAFRDAAPSEPDTLLAKMQRLRDAITALEGEEIVYSDAIELASAARVAREYIIANEADDD